MADTAPSPSGIDALLEQRARFEAWLTRLDEAGGRAPDAVRERVRADYRQRLAEVLEQLRGHAATISGELESQRRRQGELAARRDAVQERIAEAEIRHAVGEYSAAEWERVSAETGRELAEANEALERVTAEIARLAEVDRLIAGAPAPAAPAAASQPVEAAATPGAEPPAEDVGDGTVAAEPAAEPTVAGTPAPPADEPATDEPGPMSDSVANDGAPGGPSLAAPREDELAFLQSLAGSTGQGTPAPAAAPVAAAPAPAAAPATAPAPAATAASAKTLKCGECGTLNRPTEWYCERCGAELSTL
ncbi:MAG TPA: hypothetical protein VFS40_02320 [Gemmatimonadales bacterium]|nr:hypothetical protein [Gemmatimonadales bacterium]